MWRLQLWRHKRQTRARESPAEAAGRSLRSETPRAPAARRQTPGLETGRSAWRAGTGTPPRVPQACLRPLEDPRNSQRLAFGCLTRRARWAGREARPGGSPLPRPGGQHSGWLGLGSSPLGAPYDSDTSRQFPSTSHAPDGVGRRWPGLCASRCGRLSAQPCPVLPCVHPSALAAHRLSKKKRSCRL